MIGLLGELARVLEVSGRRLRGEYEEDEWGYDPGFAGAAEPLLGFLHDRWWRVTTTGAEHVPASGRALIVANRAAELPWEAAMAGHVLRRAGMERDARFLVDERAVGLPFVSTAVRRCGGVPSSAHNALRLLGQDHLVLVFPEGGKAVAKPWDRRYRLERFGRGGFVELALRTGAPIVPCAVVGSEELHPRVARLPRLPLLGPLGPVPLPSRWRIAFGEPLDLSGLGPAAADDQGTLLEVADDVRARVQAMLLDNLAARQGAYL